MPRTYDKNTQGYTKIYTHNLLYNSSWLITRCVSTQNEGATSRTQSVIATPRLDLRHCIRLVYLLRCLHSARHSTRVITHGTLASCCRLPVGTYDAKSGGFRNFCRNFHFCQFVPASIRLWIMLNSFPARGRRSQTYCYQQGMLGSL